MEGGGLVVRFPRAVVELEEELLVRGGAFVVVEELVVRGGAFVVVEELVVRGGAFVVEEELVVRGGAFVVEEEVTGGHSSHVPAVSWTGAMQLMPSMAMCDMVVKCELACNVIVSVLADSATGLD